MHIQDAESLLDGGTTCLTVIDGNKKKFITIDYSFPMDGRPRHIYLGTSQFSKGQKLAIDSPEEKEIIDWLINELIAQFGAGNIQDFIEGTSGGFGSGKWRFALNFLSILAKERDLE